MYEELLIFGLVMMLVDGLIITCIFLAARRARARSRAIRAGRQGGKSLGTFVQFTGVDSADLFDDVRARKGWRE